MGLIFAIGDIHGCRDPLERMLIEIEAYAPSGTTVFLGDYVDRGPDSRGVIERLMAGPQKAGWNWITLKGNHEDMMVKACSRPQDRDDWLTNGGTQTELSYGGEVSEAHLAWAAALPCFHSDDHRIFAHAGVVSGIALSQQRERDLLWMRFAPDDNGEGDYGGKHLCHGHTPSSSNPRTIGHRTNVDSACVFGHHLSCAIFDDEQAGGPIGFIKVRA